MPNGIKRRNRKCGEGKKAGGLALSLNDKMIRDMNAFVERAKAVSELVGEVEKSTSFDYLKRSLTTLINYAGKDIGRRRSLQEQLNDMIIKVSEPFLKPSPEQKKNVMYIPAPLWTCYDDTHLCAIDSGFRFLF
jgi:hypothetical protein